MGWFAAVSGHGMRRGIGCGRSSSSFSSVRVSCLVKRGMSGLGAERGGGVGRVREEEFGNSRGGGGSQRRIVGPGDSRLR